MNTCRASICFLVGINTDIGTSTDIGTDTYVGKDTDSFIAWGGTYLFATQLMSETSK